MIIYKQPRYGIFKHLNGEYDIHNGGWQTDEQRELIIGEVNDGYITRFYESKLGYWDDYGRYEAWSTSALIIHKSWFVKWDSQLTLF